MNEAFYRELVEAGWRRPLSAQDKAALASYLALHPETQAEWAEDLALSEILHQLPEADRGAELAVEQRRSLCQQQ